MRFLIFCDVNRFESRRPAAFSTTMKAHGKLMALNVVFLFQLSVLAAQISLPAALPLFDLASLLPYLCLRSAALSFSVASRGKEDERKNIWWGHLNLLCSLPRALARCIFPQASFIPSNKPIKTNYCELLLSPESTFLSKFYVLNFSPFVPPPPFLC